MIKKILWIMWFVTIITASASIWVSNLTLEDMFFAQTFVLVVWIALTGLYIGLRDMDKEE